MRGRGVTFGRAVAASAGLHLLLVVAAVVAVRRAGPPAADRPPAPPVPVVVLSAPDPARVVRPDRETPQPPPAQVTPPPPAEAPATGARPEVVRVPGPLPPHLLDRIRNPRPASVPVVEVPVTVAPPAPALGPTAPDVRPAAGTADPSPDPLANGKPLHGPLPAGQAVVYVLDASGSMGEAGKFDRARAAVLATLRAQPAGARFQVLVYDSDVRTPVPAGGGWLAVAPEAVGRVAAALRALPDPAGRSSHADGLRAALRLRPDVVVLFTDADDRELARLRAVVGGAGRPLTACVARVTAADVSAPARLP